VRACLRLLDRSDLLLLREPALAHDSSAFGAPESDYKWIRFRGSAHSCACSPTSRTARSRTSAEYCFALAMAPISQGLEPPANPGRFSVLSGNRVPYCRGPMV